MSSRRPAGALAVLAVVMAGAVFTHPVDQAAAAETVVFQDDFSGDLSRWNTQAGRRGDFNWGTGELQTYTTDPAVIGTADGNLVITPELRLTGWYSGRVMSREAFTTKPGERTTVRGRLALPEGAPGMWPAFWLLSDGIWPLDGELDMLERVNASPRYFHTLHCDTVPGGACNEPQGKDAYTTCEPCSDFHTYGVVIDRRDGVTPSITFTFDDIAQNTLTPADFPEHPEAFDAVIDSPYRLILNVAVGGSFPSFDDPDYLDKMDRTPGPRSPLRVDYVSVAKDQ